jgi:hypothetical protein
VAQEASNNRTDGSITQIDLLILFFVGYHLPNKKGLVHRFVGLDKNSKSRNAALVNRKVVL